MLSKRHLIALRRLGPAFLIKVSKMLLGQRKREVDINNRLATPTKKNTQWVKMVADEDTHEVTKGTKTAADVDSLAFRIGEEKQQGTNTAAVKKSEEKQQETMIPADAGRRAVKTTNENKEESNTEADANKSKFLQRPGEKIHDAHVQEKLHQKGNRMLQQQVHYGQTLLNSNYRPNSIKEAR